MSHVNLSPRKCGNAWPRERCPKSRMKSSWPTLASIPCGPKVVFRRDYGLLSHDQCTLHAVYGHDPSCTKLRHQWALDPDTRVGCAWGGKYVIHLEVVWRIFDQPVFDLLHVYISRSDRWRRILQRAGCGQKGSCSCASLTWRFVGFNIHIQSVGCLGLGRGIVNFLTAFGRHRRWC